MSGRIDKSQSSDDDQQADFEEIYDESERTRRSSGGDRSESSRHPEEEEEEKKTSETETAKETTKNGKKNVEKTGEEKKKDDKDDVDIQSVYDDDSEEESIGNLSESSRRPSEEQKKQRNIGSSSSSEEEEETKARNSTTSLQSYGESGDQVHCVEETQLSIQERRQQRIEQRRQQMQNGNMSPHVSPNQGGRPTRRPRAGAARSDTPVMMASPQTNRGARGGRNGSMRGSTRGSMRGSMRDSSTRTDPTKIGSTLELEKSNSISSLNLSNHNNLNDSNRSCPALMQGIENFDESEQPYYYDGPIDAHELAHLQAQMLAQQEQTNKALKDLSTTMQTLMMAQIKSNKEADEGTKNILEVDRATVRLDGLEVYAVVSALTLATAIACFDSYDFQNTVFSYHEITRENFVNLLLNTVFLVVSGVGIIAGLHATLVFSLMTMYGRTAVGVSHDEAFVEFFVQTGRVRYRGFHTFRLSLYSFLVQVLFTITSKCSPILRPLVILINLVSMYWVYVDTQSVIEKAGEILFNFNAKKLKRMSEAGSLSLQRTLSSTENNQSSRSNDPRRASAVSRGLTAMRNRVKSGIGNKTASARALVSTNGRYSRKKGVARSNSGTEIFDVGEQDAEKRPHVRRAGKKPTNLNKKGK